MISLLHSRCPKRLYQRRIIAGIDYTGVASFDDEVEKRFELGISEACGGLGTPFGQKEKELIEVLRRYSTDGGISKERSQIPKEVAITLPGLFTDTVLLMVFEYLDCLP
jgi:hypothetical protein